MHDRNGTNKDRNHTRYFAREKWMNQDPRLREEEGNNKKKEENRKKEEGNSEEEEWTLS